MFLNLEGDAQQSDDDRDLEATHFNECVLAFLNYAQRNIAANKKRRSDILSLPSTQTRYLKNLPRKIAGAEQRINANAAFLEMLANENITPELLEEREKPVLESNADKVRSTLRQFVRDWSEEGKPERDATYTVILDELEARFQSVPVEER
ncbi:hypothetical protein HK097_010604 [Rhizophlyctis rosea]|uniref:Uncharacterized protein n=1 Tax=Rhizophlyctis rosea TaxID=64517 RepID=A0AAD5SLZ8_9FUNG|nr:hypothetical protein HK097_010604 [Rhizophlyctis rosea]